jgi:hypothetical protein
LVARRTLLRIDHGKKGSTMKARLVAGMAFAALLVACGGGGGGGGGGTCMNIAGIYNGTEAIGTNSCGISPHTISPSATLTFSQADGKCDFTMTNSLVPGVTYSGTIDSSNDITWTSSPASYAENGGYTTITSVSVTATAEAAPAVASLDGSFHWAWAHTEGGATVCTGTTTLTSYVQ